MLGQGSTAEVVSDRDGSGLTGGLCHHGETVRVGIPWSQQLSSTGDASGDSRHVEDTEAFMRIMLHRVLPPRGVACCCRNTAHQWPLPLLQGLWPQWPPLRCSKETLAASGHAAPREQVRGIGVGIFNDRPSSWDLTGTGVCLPRKSLRSQQLQWHSVQYSSLGCTWGCWHA